MTAVVVIEGLVILLLLILVAGLLKSHAEILRQLHGLTASPGPQTDSSRSLGVTGFEEAPDKEIVGLDPSGAARTITLEHGRGETLLAFLSTGCASCRIFWEALEAPPELPTPTTRPIIITKGPAAESPTKVRQLAPSGTPVVMSDDAWDRFRVPLTPYFMLVDGDARVIGEGSASTWDHLISLLGQSLEDFGDPVRLNTGEREEFTDERLSQSGVDPGDPSLYKNPVSE